LERKREYRYKKKGRREGREDKWKDGGRKGMRGRGEGRKEEERCECVFPMHFLLLLIAY